MYNKTSGKPNALPEYFKFLHDSHKCFSMAGDVIIIQLVGQHLKFFPATCS